MGTQGAGAMLGKRLSARYRVVEMLGSGGFGHTYVAEDTQRPGHPCCVLKHLSFASTNPTLLQQARRMFLAEAETLERLGKHDQIPQLLAYFEEDQEFYLVQELIRGHSLRDELPDGCQWSTERVTELLQDVLGILTFVHAEGVIHRDIKPDNLIRRASDQKLVLIDFGAVKNIEQTIAKSLEDPDQYSVPVFTSGYGASEQCLGQPQFSSDIYALGMIGIQALTGIRPSQLEHDWQTGELVWREYTQVNGPLIEVLQTMTRYLFTQRYPSATAALQALQGLPEAQPAGAKVDQAKVDHDLWIDHTQAPDLPVPVVPTVVQAQQSNWRRPAIALAAIGAITAVGGGAWTILQGRVPFAPRPLGQTVDHQVSDQAGHAAGNGAGNGAGNQAKAPIQNHISRGERSLLPGAAPAKQAGIEQIANGQTAAAISWLTKARQADRADPETLIYLNNARIGQQPAYTLAVAVPLGSQPKSATEILRGVAQAQEQVNQAGGLAGRRLRVAIANDDNQPQLAQQVATALTADPQVLGVIGHGTSNTTLAAAPVYQSQKLVAISPVSSAVQLADFSRYVWRTMPSDRFAAQQLGQFMQTRLKQRRAAVFFNSQDAYSKSLMGEFRQALFYGNKGEVVAEIDLSKPDFDATESLEQAIQKKAEVIFLAATNEVSDRALLVVQMNQKRLPLLAGDALYTSKTLQVGQAAAVGMVLAVPSIEKSPFQAKAAALWGRQVNWRTILAYDATQALLAALRQNPTRQGLRQVLADPKFVATGATGPVQFTPTGDRQRGVKLVQVVMGRSGDNEFKPLP
jgi:eukaryotic-like serine/threonine-protein kinase